MNVADLRNGAGSVATNPIIQAYVKEKYGFYVHSLYIAQVRGKLGVKQHENYGRIHTSKRKVSTCPPYKEAAIMDALRYFHCI